MSDPAFIEAFGEITDEDIVQEAIRIVGQSSAYLTVVHGMQDMCHFSGDPVPEQYRNYTHLLAVRREAAMQARILEVFEAYLADEDIPDGAEETDIIDERPDGDDDDDDECTCGDVDCGDLDSSPVVPTPKPAPPRGPNLFG